MTKSPTNDIVEKNIPDVRIAGIRWKGRYSDTGKQLGRLARQMGRYLSGKPFNLYYDECFRDEDADIESCYPVREGREIPARDGVSVRVLPGGKVVSIIHQGPYYQLGRSYEKIDAYLKQKNRTVSGPPREVYLKGPGMIFRGDPKKYLTEIQFPVSG